VTGGRFPAWKPELDARRADVLRVPGVLSVGIGGRPGNERVVVTVETRADASEASIRSILEGFRVEIVRSERFVFY
jgi:hypothetical protein